MMEYCKLIQLDNGRWKCTECDGATLPVEATRYCGMGQRQTEGPATGPGTELHKLLSRIAGEAPTATCGCKDRIARMDRWGPDGCREHLDEIVDWLLKEAEERGWKSTRWLGSRLAVKTLVRWAIRQAERKEAIISG